ncbi:hypothetical protein PALI_a1552 [Pseudoalteromonas aliena SW19]|uniref:Transposase n=1 Tax=Pseudoalteromonas aliena SW19 TaxID=1314866 RepID=A0ABR9DXA6_9GAMM|nr:hypothetical protein [Pseudoalteromonas aliena SW19]
MVISYVKAKSRPYLQLVINQFVKWVRLFLFNKILNELVKTAIF